MFFRKKETPAQQKPTDLVAEHQKAICENWMAKAGKPAYIVSMRCWGIIHNVVDDTNVQLRVSNGKVVSVPLADITCTDVEPPRVFTIIDTDDDNNSIEVGCGDVDQQKMFWIETSEGCLTVSVSDTQALLNAIQSVLK